MNSFVLVGSDIFFAIGLRFGKISLNVILFCEYCSGY